jgi:phosphohistidine phosphatase
MATQRRLILMRHGHAEENRDDYVRTLSERGRTAARRSGEELLRAGIVPAHILTSAAPRALETAELVAHSCGYQGAIQQDRGLYLAAPSGYRSALQDLPAQLSSVLLVGHNPSLSELAQELGRRRGDLAPAEYERLELDLLDWSEL